MFLKSKYSKLSELIFALNFRRFPLRFFTTQRDNLQLIKKVSVNRTEWEKLRTESQEDSTHYYNIESEAALAHTGFGKSLTSKSKFGLKYLGMLQRVSQSTSQEKFNSLLEEISTYIDEFTPCELIDISYFLTRINRIGSSQVVEPILHRFFSLPERFSCLNGVYFHRLLRTMFIYQDVTYRLWVYEIAQMLSYKHDHLLMRDIQLIVDDLSLFYDAAAQSSLQMLEDTVISRVNELDMYRLPLLLHALGRCGYNSINVAKVVHNVYVGFKGHQYYYSPHLIGLVLKGYVSFHFHPGTEFLDDIWENIKHTIKKIEFKYLSWISESFLRLRYFPNIKEFFDELIPKRNLLSYLEFTDFISSCWSIQSHILSLEFKPYLVPGSIWQDVDHTQSGEEKGARSSTLSQENNSKEVLDTLCEYYDKIFSLVMNEVPSKVYDCTPPYRVTQFEVLTRLLHMYPNPRDFRIVMPLRKYDMAYPVLKFPNVVDQLRPGDIEYMYVTMDYLGSSNFFGEKRERGARPDTSSVESMALNTAEEPLRSLVRGERAKELKPLHPLLKNYIHSFFFRTPALAPRGLRLLIQGLVRIHFEQREEGNIDKDLLPSMRLGEVQRPFSCAIVREMYRKLACFNNDDLIVSLFGMIALKMFDIELARELMNQAIQMWTHQNTEKILRRDQKELLSLFFKTLGRSYPSIYSSLDTEAIAKLLQ
ncbi:hypothetical protein MACK_001538 [Theileria orientalis]|uniref:Uncharacterized protein n=1 Tax=Theileria orientalis TaxID=68886 RepID=A0A976MD58_THEOR|nr:hypothetical protein MACK_001538 [Theileria orientalis]